MVCSRVSSTLITICMRGNAFTIIQAYAPTSTYKDSEVQAVLNQIPNKDIIVVPVDWNSKAGDDAYTNWKDAFGPYINSKTNDRSSWSLPDGEHTLPPDDGPGTAPVESTITRSMTIIILVKKHFRSSVNTGRTCSFARADIGSDHNLVLISCHLYTWTISKAQSALECWSGQTARPWPWLQGNDRREVCPMAHPRRRRKWKHDHHV